MKLACVGSVLYLEKNRKQYRHSALLAPKIACAGSVLYLEMQKKKNCRQSALLGKSKKCRHYALLAPRNGQFSWLLSARKAV